MYLHLIVVVVAVVGCVVGVDNADVVGFVGVKVLLCATVLSFVDALV